MSVRHVAFLTLTSAAVALAGCARKPPEPAKTPPPVVIVDHPVAQQVTDYEDFAGHTEPYRVVEIKSRATGYLKSIHFKDGQDIEQGKRLFEIDERVYKAEVDKAHAALNKSKKHLQTVTADYRRAVEQYEKGVIGKEGYDKAVGDRAEAEADIESAAAALELAETNLHFCTIYSPFDGRLSRRMVDENNLVQADTTLLTTIVRLDEVYATFDVDERTVMRLRKLIREGKLTSSRVQPRTVQIALADDDDFSLTGQVVFSDNQIDAGTGTLRVRALVTNPKLTTPPYYMLSPGQFVRIRMPVGPPRRAVLVSEKAIGSDQGQRYVFVVRTVEKDGAKKQVVERRNVRVGQQYGTLRVIEGGGLTPSDRVVTEGLLRVRDRAEVNPQPAAKQPKSAAAAAPVKVVVQAPAPHPKT
jgi:RND family efflux transporter MFP subunit